jgi:hypothetical protein
MLPVTGVKMNHLDIQRFPYHPGQGRLAGTARPKSNDPVHQATVVAVAIAMRRCYR